MEPFDTSRPNIARVWDYWLGGKENFAADRELAEKMLAVHPVTAQMARENRQFLGRAVSYVADRGIGQFIDVGAPADRTEHARHRPGSPAEGDNFTTAYTAAQLYIHPLDDIVSSSPAWSSCRPAWSRSCAGTGQRTAGSLAAHGDVPGRRRPQILNLSKYTSVKYTSIMAASPGRAAPKPSHLFDRDAEWAGLVGFALDTRPGATLGVVSGRRRQGKSYLLQALATALGGIYFPALELTEAVSLRLFADELIRFSGSPVRPFRDWLDAIPYLFRLAGIALSR